MNIENEILTINGESPVIKIDRSKCIGCSMCQKVCMVKLFDYDKGGAVFKGPNSLCVRCAQCVAICPAEAIKIEMKDGSLAIGEEIPLGERTCDPNLMLNQIKFRRSIRVFRNKKVEDEKVAKLIEAIDYAPKGNNRPLFRGVIIANEIDEYRELFLRELKEVALALPSDSPLISAKTPEASEAKRMRMAKFYDNYIESNHRVDGLTFNAPLMIVLIADKTQGGRMLWDSGITLAYVEQMAVSMGLGGTYLGIAMTAAENSEVLRKKFNLKENEAFAGIMVLGYPEASYKRVAVREKTEIEIK